MGLIQRWLGAWRTRAEDRAVARRPIPDDLWKRTLVRYPFLRRRDPATAARLRRMASLFLDRKEFTGAGGLVVRNDVAVAIAAQACLPVLELGLDRYDGFVGIVVHPDAVRARRSHVDDAGVVHEYDETLAGEAMHGGPVMLSWRDVRAAGLEAEAGYNVVIHEFAHILDMADGAANGVPPLPPDLSGERWRRVFQGAYDGLVRAIDAGEQTLLDPYAANGPEEFFAVASEAFFVQPTALKSGEPALYDVLSRYYRQDPASEPVTRTTAAQGGR